MSEAELHARIDAGGSGEGRPLRVAVVGGGIAGLTAAYYLARQEDFEVTLFEEKSFLGGNLATRGEADGVKPGAQTPTTGEPIADATEQGGHSTLDVYPHMYQAWYKNFWSLLEAVGVDLHQNFRSFKSVHQLKRGSDEVDTLTYPYSLRYLLKNLASGVAPPTDLILFGYANIDLLAERRQPSVRLGNTSLTGYLNTRLYMTRPAIEAFESFISRVWAIPAYQISAWDCRTYSEYCYAAGDQNCWLTTEPAAFAFINQIGDKLERLGAKVEIGNRVTRIEQANIGGKAWATVLKYQPTEYDEETEEWQPRGTKEGQPVEEMTASPAFDRVILALPPMALAALAREGDKGTRLVDAIEDLSELGRIGSQRVPIVNVYFKKKLACLPEDNGPIALAGSKLNLSVTNLSRTWLRFEDKPEETVLALTCSEPYALTGPDWCDDGMAMIKELAEYLQGEFRPGERWKESPDIDWGRTCYYSNIDAQLSLNPIGTGQWRPYACSEKLANVFFAGDCCHNEFGITTVEAAVATGIDAVNALMAASGLGEEVELVEPDTLSSEDYVILRWLWLPTALAAKAATMTEGRDPKEKTETRAPSGLLRYLLTPGMTEAERPKLNREPASGRDAG